MTQGTTVLDAVAERVARGEALTEADGAAVLATTDLIAVGILADEVRRRLHGPRTTFNRVLEVHVDAVPASLPEKASYGELRIVGRPRDPDIAVSAVRSARALDASAPLTGFSLVDLVALGPGPSLFQRLRDAGLQAVAEVPVGRSRDAAEVVRQARAAGLQVLRLTVHDLPDEDRVAVVCAARDLQAAVGGFRAFAPLPRSMSSAQPTTGYDDVKLVALARVMATGIPSIQVDWQLYGPKLAQVALTMGADDVDGVGADPGALGTRRSPAEEIRGNIRAAALEPAERNGLFEAIG
ncbi:MAG TPA: hypothetical protein VD833_26355 [Vicinamibacterales bacterium]|nr:hypothetical protein [Vicinamibacterales bacterium]